MISRSAAHAVSRNVATFQRHTVSHCVNLKKLQKTDPDKDFCHFYQSYLSMCCYVNILLSYRCFSSKSKSAWYEVVGVCLMLMWQLAIWALAPWQLPLLSFTNTHSTGNHRPRQDGDIVPFLSDVLWSGGWLDLDHTPHPEKALLILGVTPRGRTRGLQIIECGRLLRRRKDCENVCQQNGTAEHTKLQLQMLVGAKRGKMREWLVSKHMFQTAEENK